MSESKKKQQDFVPIGTFLKQAREKKNLSQSSVSQKTKINLTLLKALEENQLDELPKKTYVKGFVKAFARDVGLNIDLALEKLDETYKRAFSEEQELEPEATFPIPNRDEQGPRQSVQSKVKSTYKSIPQQIWMGLGLCVVLTFLATFLFTRESQDKEETTQVTTKPDLETRVASIQLDTPPVVQGPEVQTPSEVEEKAEAAVQKKVEKSAEEDIVVKQEEEKVEESKPVAKVVEKQKENDLESQGLKRINFQYFEEPLYQVQSDSEGSEYLPEKIKQSLIPNAQNVFINAVSGDTWLTYKNGQGPIKSFVLKKGRTLLLRGKEIRVFLGNVNVTRVFLNNKPLKINTNNGVKSLIFPQEAIKKFPYPLFVRDNKGKTYTSNEYIELMNQDRL